MGRITLSGCAMNNRITRDEVEFDPVSPGADMRRDPTHRIKLQSNNVFILLYTYINLTTILVLMIKIKNGKI